MLIYNIFYRKIVHNNLCQLFAACLITPHVCIMQEYSVNGSLKGILHDPEVMIDKDLAIQLAIDVGNGKKKILFFILNEYMKNINK